MEDLTKDLQAMFSKIENIENRLASLSSADILNRNVHYLCENLEDFVHIQDNVDGDAMCYQECPTFLQMLHMEDFVRKMEPIIEARRNARIAAQNSQVGDQRNVLIRQLFDERNEARLEIIQLLAGKNALRRQQIANDRGWSLEDLEG